jgi:NADH dehydrogenase FAD-containing subunit
MRLEKPADKRDQKLVVIIGGGFAGLNAARRLANVPGVHVLLVDKRNHHLFQPLLYQVATAGLNAADIAVPIRRDLQGCPREPFSYRDRGQMATIGRSRGLRRPAGSRSPAGSHGSSGCSCTCITSLVFGIGRWSCSSGHGITSSRAERTG